MQPGVQAAVENQWNRKKSPEIGKGIKEYVGVRGMWDR
jgi:hypothetical protein